MYNVTSLLHYLKVIDWINVDLSKSTWEQAMEKAAKNFCKKNNLIINEDILELYLKWKNRKTC